MISVNVVYFASVREKMGKAHEVVSLSEGGKVSDLLAVLKGQYDNKALETLADPQLLCAVNQEMTDFTQPLNDNDEVAFFPPVTGG